MPSFSFVPSAEIKSAVSFVPMTSRELPPQLPRRRTVHVPAQLIFPQVEAVSVLALRAKALEAAAKNAYPSTRQSVDRFLRLASDLGRTISGYPALHDELSAYLGRGHAAHSPLPASKVGKEFAVYARLAERSGPFLNLGQDDFLAWLMNIHRRLGTGANAFRTQPVCTAKDSAGNEVVFPHFTLCRPLLLSLHAFIHKYARTYPSLCATAAYVAVNHAHPFTDGNGRTARAVFNLVMSAAGSRHFLPIHSFTLLSGGSLTIKLRRAMYDADWEPLLAFFADATRLSDRLQRDEGASAVLID